jgi:hypothetical protein
MATYKSPKGADSYSFLLVIVHWCFDQDSDELSDEEPAFQQASLFSTGFTADPNSYKGKLLSSEEPIDAELVFSMLERVLSGPLTIEDVTNVRPASPSKAPATPSTPEADWGPMDRSRGDFLPVSRPESAAVQDHEPLLSEANDEFNMRKSRRVAKKYGRKTQKFMEKQKPAQNPVQPGLHPDVERALRNIGGPRMGALHWLACV